MNSAPERDWPFRKLLRFSWLIAGEEELAWECFRDGVASGLDRAGDFHDAARGTMWLAGRIGDLAAKRGGTGKDAKRSAAAGVLAEIAGEKDAADFFKVDRVLVTGELTGWQEVPVPATLAMRLTDWRPRERLGWKARFCQPAGLAVLAAALCLCGAIAWQMADHRRSFKGKELVEDLMDRADQMTGNEIEEIDVAASDFGDWALLHGMEGANLPASFDGFRVRGGRILRLPDGPVAQAAMMKDGEPLLVHVFKARQLGVTVEPSGTWRFLEQPPWSAGVVEEGNTCLVVVMREEVSKLEEYIEKNKMQ